MEELIELLQSIKDEAKEIQGCTIVVKMNDGYSKKMITRNDWGLYIEDLC